MLKKYGKMAHILLFLALFLAVPFRAYAETYDGVHVYMIVDCMSAPGFGERGEPEALTRFARQIKSANPNNKVSAILYYDYLYDDGMGFFGNFGGFDKEITLKANPTIGVDDALQVYGNLKSREGWQPKRLKDVLLFVNSELVLSGPHEKYATGTDRFQRMRTGLQNGYEQILNQYENLPGKRDSYVIMFPAYNGDGGPGPGTEETRFIMESMDKSVRFGTLLMHKIQNGGYRKCADSEDLPAILSQLRPKILSRGDYISDVDGIKNPYTVEAKAIKDPKREGRFTVQATVVKNSRIKELKDVSFRLKAPQDWKIRGPKGEEDGRHIDVGTMKGDRLSLQWELTTENKSKKFSETIELEMTNTSRAPYKKTMVFNVDLNPNNQQHVKEDCYWSFKNFETGSYDVSHPYMVEKLKKMKPVDRAFTRLYLKGNIRGHCFGMSATSILDNINRLNKEEWGLQDSSGRPLSNDRGIRFATKESSAPLLAFYQMSQISTVRGFVNTGTAGVSGIGKSAMGWIKSSKGDTGVPKLLQAMKNNNGVPVLVSYSYVDGKGKRYYHAIVAHSIMYRPGETYDYRIGIYDSNRPNRLYDDAIYVNSKTNEWYDPDDPDVSVKKKASINYICTDVRRLDPFAQRSDSHPWTVFGLFASGGERAYRIEALDGSGKAWTVDTRDMENSPLPFIPVTGDSGGEAQAFYVFAPKNDIPYKVSSAKGGEGKLNVQMAYSNQLVAAQVERGASLIFEPKGQLKVENARGKLHATLVRNRTIGDEFNEYELSATASGDVVLSQNGKGLEAKGRLRSLALQARDESDALTKFPRGDVSGTKLFGGKAGRGSSDLPFTDVSSGDWFYPAVSYVYKHSFMKGMGENRFSPSTTITRAQMAQIVYNMEMKNSGVKSAKFSAPFTDVEAGKWYAEAINWAAENKIVAGYGKGRFGPNDPVKREDAIVILYRYKTQSKGEKPSRAKLSAFKDEKTISPYAYDAMAWATDRGYVRGDNEKRLNSKAHTRRSEMAQMLMKINADSK